MQPIQCLSGRVWRELHPAWDLLHYLGVRRSTSCMWGELRPAWDLLHDKREPSSQPYVEPALGNTGAYSIYLCILPLLHYMEEPRGHRLCQLIVHQANKLSTFLCQLFIHKIFYILVTDVTITRILCCSIVVFLEILCSVICQCFLNGAMLIHLFKKPTQSVLFSNLLLCISNASCPLESLWSWFVIIVLSLSHFFACSDTVLFVLLLFVL